MEEIEIGQVLRASTEGFTCGTRSSEVRYPAFGTFVWTESIGQGDFTVVMGVITAIRVDDDPLVRQLIMASDVNPSIIRDQRENRMIPIEIDVLNLGYVYEGKAYHTLPPRPPMSLDAVQLCKHEEVALFTEKPSFFRLILSATGVPNPYELVAAVVRNAAAAHSREQQVDFLVSAGREIAKLLSHDPQTLHHLLSLIKP